MESGKGKRKWMESGEAGVDDAGRGEGEGVETWMREMEGVEMEGEKVWRCEVWREWKAWR